MDYKEIKGLTLNNITEQTINDADRTLPRIKYNALVVDSLQPKLRVLADGTRGAKICSNGDSFAPEAGFIRNSSVANFFSTHLISVPRCLKTSPKRYLPSNHLPTLHLINMLMRSGKKERMFSVVWGLLLKLKIHEGCNDWAIDYSQSFLDLLTPYEPIFAYKIQKVAKSTRKNSRGKSGKYLILWKYVPVYKRLQVVLRWLLTDIRLSKGRTFTLRCNQAFNSLVDERSGGTLHKLRKFNHAFVFKYFKKTLLTSLRTARSRTTN